LRNQLHAIFSLVWAIVYQLATGIAGLALVAMILLASKCPLGSVESGSWVEASLICKKLLLHPPKPTNMRTPRAQMKMNTIQSNQSLNSLLHRPNRQIPHNHKPFPIKLIQRRQPLFTRGLNVNFNVAHSSRISYT